MQAMKCDICGSNDIVKQDGLFVCQHCGTKYTVEEARKLLGYVKIDQSEENEKYLTLARRAVKNKDIDNGIKYWELIAENDPMNWEAIFYLPYFRILKNPMDEDLVVPFSNAIKEAFDLIHEKEPIEEQPTIIKELCTKVKEAGQTVFLKVIDIAGKYLDKVFSGDALALFPSIPFPSRFLEATIEKIRELYPDNSELLSIAQEMEKDAKEYKEYPTNTIKKAGEYSHKRIQGENESLQREYQESRVQRGGCYIATCVYGSYDCPQVWTLRRFRDNILVKTWYGRAFISVYYFISPRLVRLFGDATWFKKMWKKRLDTIVKTLQDDGFSDTPYEDNYKST